MPEHGSHYDGEDEDDGRRLEISGSEVDPDELEWDQVHKKPVAVEAVEIPAPFEVETLEGTMSGQAGDILIRGVEGEIYPCDPGIFASTYISDSERVPKYTSKDIKQAKRKFRDDTLGYVPTGVTDTDARAGMRGFLDALKEVKHD